MDKIEIREAKLEDFGDIFILLKQLWKDKELHKNKLEAIYTRSINATDEKNYSACIEDKVIGFCSMAIKNSLWQEGKIGYVNELVVDLPYRGKGIGTGLLNTACMFAKVNQCRRIELDSAFSRDSAHAFYLNKGFEKRAYLFSKVL